MVQLQVSSRQLVFVPTNIALPMQMKSLAAIRNAAATNVHVPMNAKEADQPPASSQIMDEFVVLHPCRSK